MTENKSIRVGNRSRIAVRSCKINCRSIKMFLLFYDAWYYGLRIKVFAFMPRLENSAGIFPSISSELPQIRRALKSLRISLRGGIVKGSIKKREESRLNKSDQRSGHPGESRTMGKSHWTTRLNRRLRNRSMNHSISLGIPTRCEIAWRRKKI